METGGGFKTEARGSEHGRQCLNHEPFTLNPLPQERCLEQIAISFELLFEADITENAMIPLPNSSTHAHNSLTSAAILVTSRKTIVSFSVSSFPIRLQDAPPIAQNICHGFCEKFEVHQCINAHQRRVGRRGNWKLI
jgi:hypothetical protein